MAGHSKWSTIKHKKAIIDAKRSKIFSKHVKLISVAAKSGNDLSMNPTLAIAVDNAKKDNLPADKIEKAILVGSGLDKNKNELIEIMYEGYAVNGIAVLVEVITDNKNRSIAEIRHVFSKYGGNMAEPGSVSFNFDRMGKFLIEKKDIKNIEELSLELIDMGVLDIIEEDDNLICIIEPNMIKDFKKLLDDKIQYKSLELSFIPKNYIEVSNKEIKQKIIDFIDSMEELEDVSCVYANYKFI